MVNKRILPAACNQPFGGQYICTEILVKMFKTAQVGLVSGPEFAENKVIRSWHAFGQSRKHVQEVNIQRVLNCPWRGSGTHYPDGHLAEPHQCPIAEHG